MVRMVVDAPLRNGDQASAPTGRVMLETMLYRSQPNPIITVKTVCGGAPVMAHNMITTIMNTAA